MTDEYVSPRPYPPGAGTRRPKRMAQDPRLRVAAARCLVDATPSQAEAVAMAAFMGIFHPGHPATEELVREARKGKGHSV